MFFGTNRVWRNATFGATSAVFSVVRTVMLEPLPYRDPDRIVVGIRAELELEMVDALGYRVTAVSDGSEALQKLTTVPASAILTVAAPVACRGRPVP